METKLKFGKIQSKYLVQEILKYAYESIHCLFTLHDLNLKSR